MNTSALTKWIPVILLTTHLSGFAAPVVLDFETKPDGTAAANGDRLLSYAAYGIEFVHPLEVVRCEASGGNNDPDSCPAARSGSNMVRPVLNTEFRRHLINVRFAAAQDSVTGYIRYDSGSFDNGREVHAVMNAFDETDAFLGNATVTFIHSTATPGWNTITKSVDPPLFGEPARKIRRIEIWGGLNSGNSPPTRDVAENFLLLDDLTFEPAAVPGDTTPPELTVYWPSSGTVTTSSLVGSRIYARDETRLQSVDVRVVHISSTGAETVTLEYTGGSICGGPGLDACPEREFGTAGSGRLFEVPLWPSLTGNYRLTFRACDAAGNCTERSRNIVLEIPLRIQPGSFTPVEGIPPVDPHFSDEIDLTAYPELDGEGRYRGTEVTLTGENFHDRMTVFLYDCPEVPPLSDCHEGANYFRMNVVPGSLETERIGPSGERLPDVVRVTVPELSDLPAIVDGKPYSIVIRDDWSRPDVVPGTISQWRKFGPPGTYFRIRLPEYPRMHGFNFVNDGEAATKEMFTAVFGRDAFRRRDPCRMKPLYKLYYKVFKPLVRHSDGSCVGMASTSGRFASGLINPRDFGGHYAFTLPGGPVDPDLDSVYPSPPRPAVFHRDGLCGPWRPQNLWSLIRRNHGAQFSHQFLNEVLEQLPDRSLPRFSDPGAVLDRVRRNVTGYVLCMRRDGGGHCVTPYEVVDGIRFAWGDRPGETYGTLIADPAFSAIKMYDNNFPGATNQWININRVENTYHYKWEEADSGEMHFKYHGRGLLSIPIGLWDRDLTRPTILRDGIRWILHFIFGDADVMHETADGRRWGWKPDGTFVGEYPGGYDVPGFHGNDVDLRDNVFITAPKDAPTVSRINVRGPDYWFHTDQGNTVLQLHVEDGVAGDQDRVQTQITGNRLAAFEYVPASARGTITPTVAMEFSDNESVSFEWSGLNLLKGESVAFEAQPDSKAVRCVNKSPRPARYVLKVESEDDSGEYGTGVYLTSYFGPVDLPSGAGQRLVLHGWPRLDALRSELDVNGDGVADQVEIVQGRPSLDPTQTFMGIPYSPLGNAIVVRHPNTGQLHVKEIIDEDGADGIAFHLVSANSVELALGTAPDVTQTPDRAIQSVFVHSTAGATLAALEASDEDEWFRYLIDFGPMGSHTAEIRVMNKETLLLRQTGHAGPVDAAAGIGGSLSATIRSDGQLAITLAWNRPVLVTTGNANPIQADRVMWISESPNSIMERNSLGEVTLTGYQVSYDITGIAAKPYVPPALDSSRDGDTLTLSWTRQDGLELLVSPDMVTWEFLSPTRVTGDIATWQGSSTSHPRRFFRLRESGE